MKTTDSSLRPLLALRVGERRADQILLDLSQGHQGADDSLHKALGTPWYARTGTPFPAAPVLRDGTWDGEALRMRHELPASVSQALVGRPLSDLVVHPGLPGHRTITSVERQGDDTVVRCETEFVSIESLIRIRETRLTAWARRRDEDRLMRSALQGGRGYRHYVGLPVPGILALCAAVAGNSALVLAAVDGRIRVDVAVVVGLALLAVAAGVATLTHWARSFPSESEYTQWCQRQRQLAHDTVVARIASGKP